MMTNFKQDLRQQLTTIIETEAAQKNDIDPQELAQEHQQFCQKMRQAGLDIKDKSNESDKVVNLTEYRSTYRFIPPPKKLANYRGKLSLSDKKNAHGTHLVCEVDPSMPFTLEEDAVINKSRRNGFSIEVTPNDDHYQINNQQINVSLNGVPLAQKNGDFELHLEDKLTLNINKKVTGVLDICLVWSRVDKVLSVLIRVIDELL